MPAKEDDVEIKDEKKEEVTIDVTPKEKAEIKPPVDDKTEKLHRRMEYQSRQFEKAMEEMRKINQRLAASNQQVQPKNENVDTEDIDAIAERDWKQGVKKLVTPEIEKTVKLILEEEKKERLAKSNIDTANSLREKAMAKVLEEHPEIEDEDSDFTKVYTEVVNEDSSLLSNPLGPELAMARAEKRLSKNSGKINQASQETEHQRLQRVKSTYVSQGHKPTTGNRIVLTTEEKKICDDKGIPYAEYTKMRSLTSQNFKEGVQVDE